MTANIICITLSPCEPTFYLAWDYFKPHNITSMHHSYMFLEDMLDLSSIQRQISNCYNEGAPSRNLTG